MHVETYYAVDIGGTKIATGWVDNSGRIQKQTRTETGDPEAAAEYIKRTYMEISDGSKCVIGVGAACIHGGPGGGRFMPDVATLKGWENFDLKSRLAGLGVPAFFENDTDAAALGLWHFHFRRSPNELPLVYFVASTGAGGGCVLRAGSAGYLLRGHRNEHPEFGHALLLGENRVPKKGRREPVQDVLCGCGTVNCVASYVSGRGIESRYGTRAEDAGAAVRDEVARNLSSALSVTSLYYGPRNVVLGGGVVQGWGEAFIESVRHYLKSDRSRLMSEPKVIACPIGDIGIVGAAAVAMDASRAYSGSRR